MSNFDQCPARRCAMLHPSPHNRLHSSVTESWKLPPDPEAGRIMPIAHFPGGPLLTFIERQRCLRCASRMMLSRISPRPIGFEHRRFECLKCKYVEDEVIANDPMESASVGWLAGELRAPN